MILLPLLHLGHATGGTAGTAVFGAVLFVLGIAMVLRSRYE